MLPFVINITRLVIRMIALAVVLAGLVLGREMLHETYDPRRQTQENRFERAVLPAPLIVGAAVNNVFGKIGNRLVIFLK